MTNFKAVIGANYGDEGKGLMTDYFTLNNDDSLVVLTNGGAQRGHTVRKSEDSYHVFHHYGSGVLNGASTYCSKFFMINPLVILSELKELSDNFHSVPTLYVDSKCRFTTPWDMMINQFQSKYKGTHHTCGMGIFNTYKRYKSIFIKDNPYSLSVSQYIKMSEEDKKKHLRTVRDYYKSFNIKDKDDYELFWNDNIIDNFFTDFDRLINDGLVIIIDDFKDIAYKYSNVVFENAQGLLLDWSDDKINQIYTTPSRTGVFCINELMKDIEYDDFEVCYVSRSYMTRHGDGPLHNEFIPKDYIPRYESNVENKYQGKFRYGLLDSEDLFKRIMNDFSQLNYKARLTIAYTHIDEYGCYLLPKDTEGYISSSPYASEVERI